MEHFYATTSITVGYGKKSTFWEVPWLNGKKPKEIVPLMLLASMTKKNDVSKNP
jgi:hypothetical protein